MNVNLPLEAIDMTSKMDKFQFSFCVALMMVSVGATNVSAADVSELAESCAGCHGKDGVSTESDIPTISGNSVKYIIDSMTTYSYKERPCQEVKIRSGAHKGDLDDMCRIAKDLSKSDTQLIAEYLASKPFVRAKQEFDPEKAKLGKAIQDEECTKCHEAGGSSAADDSGMLAGQWMPYIKQQFKDFSSGARPMTKKMEKKYKKLSEADLENLLHYFASFQ